VILGFLATYADPILAIVSATFTVALAPTVWHQWRVRASSVPLPSSMLTFLGLVIFTAVYAALGLWIAAGSAASTAIAWGLIAAQRVIYSSLKED
jgi:hypothetical protein